MHAQRLGSEAGLSKEKGEWNKFEVRPITWENRKFVEHPHEHQKRPQKRRRAKPRRRLSRVSCKRRRGLRESVMEDSGWKRNQHTLSLLVAR